MSEEENPIKEYKTIFERICNFIKNKKTKPTISVKLVPPIYTDNSQDFEKNLENFEKLATDFGVSLGDVQILLNKEVKK